MNIASTKRPQDQQLLETLDQGRIETPPMIMLTDGDGPNFRAAYRSFDSQSFDPLASALAKLGVATAKLIAPRYGAAIDGVVALIGAAPMVTSVFRGGQLTAGGVLEMGDAGMKAYGGTRDVFSHGTGPTHRNADIPTRFDAAQASVGMLVKMREDYLVGQVVMPLAPNASAPFEVLGEALTDQNEFLGAAFGVLSVLFAPDEWTAEKAAAVYAAGRMNEAPGAGQFGLSKPPQFVDL